MSGVLATRSTRPRLAVLICIFLLCLVALPVLGAVRLQTSVDPYIPDPNVGQVGPGGALIAGFSALFGDDVRRIMVGLIVGWLWTSSRRAEAVMSIAAVVGSDVLGRIVKAFAAAPRPSVFGDEGFSVDGPPPTIVVAVIIALLLLATIPRRREIALAMAAGIILLSAASLASDTLVPVRAGLDGFPSGHATGSMAVAAITVGAMWPTRFRYVALPAAALVVLGVAASRLYLDAHYPADVLGGWCVALASFALARTVLDARLRRSAKSRADRVAELRLGPQ